LQSQRRTRQAGEPASKPLASHRPLWFLIHQLHTASPLSESFRPRFSSVPFISVVIRVFGRDATSVPAQRWSLRGVGVTVRMLNPFHFPIRPSESILSFPPIPILSHTQHGYTITAPPPINACHTYSQLSRHVSACIFLRIFAIVSIIIITQSNRPASNPRSRLLLCKRNH